MCEGSDSQASRTAQATKERALKTRARPSRERTGTCGTQSRAHRAAWAARVPEPRGRSLQPGSLEVLGISALAKVGFFTVSGR